MYTDAYLVRNDTFELFLACDYPAVPSEEHGSRPRCADDQSWPLLPLRSKRRGVLRAHDRFGPPFHGDRHVGPADIGLPEIVGLANRAKPFPTSRLSKVEGLGNHDFPPRRGV